MAGRHRWKVQVESLCASLKDGGRLAPSWTDHKVAARLLQIRRFVELTNRIDLKAHRDIGRKAQALLESLAQLPGGEYGGIKEATILDIYGLSCFAEGRSGRGGNRRSDEHSRDGSAYRMIVRLYVEAHPKPAFSLGGPLVRFVRAVCECISIDAPTDEAVRALHRKFKALAKRPDISVIFEK